MSESAITKRAMLVNLRIGVYTGMRTDLAVAKEVEASHGTGSGVGTYRKLVLPKVALSSVNARRNVARQFHLTNTLPWGDDGSRVLPVEQYFSYMEAQAANERAFYAAVKRFIENLPMYKREAQRLLGTLWNDEDYPSTQEIEARFYFNTAILPIQSVEDFRVDIGADEAARIRDHINAELEERFTNATRDLWQRLYGTVSAMHERLSEKDATFRDSLIGNLRDLVGLLPNLNFTNDTKLEQLRQDIEASLCNVEPVEIRKSEAVRSAQARKAKEFMDKMAGYIA